MWKAIILLSVTGLAARDRIAFVDFYGAKGMDTEAVRRALPFHEGDQFVPNVTRREGREAVIRVTDVRCDPQGDTYIFIGLRGQSSQMFVMNPLQRHIETCPAGFQPELGLTASGRTAINPAGYWTHEQGARPATARSRARRCARLVD